ncbi:MAG TPA: hypothetical protein VM053_03300 [Gemmatimonadaceae bacterium]|nr:hypothetical protein [Gemmatimonadaceae bacterium]
MDRFQQQQPLVYFVLVALSSIAAGFVLEDLGARIEAQIWDPLLERDSRCQHDDWHAFLRYAPDKEAVGHRYLRTLTLRFKFELSFGLALFFSWFGMIWLDSLKLLWAHDSVILFSAICLSTASYLLWESEETARALANIRHLLLHGKQCPVVEKHAEHPIKASHFDWCVAGFAIICLLWGLWHSIWALMGHGTIGHNSGLTTALIFLLFGAVLALLWRWLKRDQHSGGRRRGFAVRVAIAFVLLAVFTVIRKLEAPELSGAEAIGVAFLGALVFSWFAFSNALREYVPAVSVKTST